VNIKLDENLPTRLGPALAGLGHEVRTVPEEGLSGRDDRAVWLAAQSESRFLITQDMDFSDRRRFAPGTHHGILLVRLRQPGRQALFDRIRGLFESENIERWRRCFAVATDRKLRVRSPR